MDNPSNWLIEPPRGAEGSVNWVNNSPREGTEGGESAGGARPDDTSSVSTQADEGQIEIESGAPAPDDSRLANWRNRTNLSRISGARYHRVDT